RALAGCDAVGAAQFLANRFTQPFLENLRHGSEGHALGFIILKRSAEDNGNLAFGLDAFLDRLLNHSLRRPDADIFPLFLPLQGWQRAKVSLNERLQCGEIEVADEEEREITRVGEAVFVKRERFI